MLSPVVRPPGLVTGERLTVEEFLRRWEELPDLKNAELIDGVVDVSSPVRREHSRLDTRIIWWLSH
jgi:Uma2 family endonuclease